MVIPPTVGRVVWFYPDGSIERTQPLAAHVACVFSDRCVNLMIIGDNGVPWSHPPTSVTLVQDGDDIPKRTDGTFFRHARWMPYQKNQAAKYDALEKEVAASRPPL